MRIEYTTVIKNGVLPRDISDKLAIDLVYLDEKEVTLSIEPTNTSRSDKQNRYYFGCVVEEERKCFRERWGEIVSKEEIHAWNKSKFFVREILDPFINEVIVFPKSSTLFSTTEFEEKLELIRRYFETKFNWYIPAPNETKLIFTNDDILGQ